MNLQCFLDSLGCANSEITTADTFWSLKATFVPSRKEGRKRGRKGEMERRKKLRRGQGEEGCEFIGNTRHFRTRRAISGTREKSLHTRNVLSKMQLREPQDSAEP